MNPNELIKIENQIVQRVVAILLPILSLQKVNIVTNRVSPEILEKKKKSTEELVCYVRYVFQNATEEEKKVAERVIHSFSSSMIGDKSV